MVRQTLKEAIHRVKGMACKRSRNLPEMMRFVYALQKERTQLRTTFTFQLSSSCSRCGNDLTKKKKKLFKSPNHFINCTLLPEHSNILTQAVQTHKEHIQNVPGVCLNCGYSRIQKVRGNSQKYKTEFGAPGRLSQLNVRLQLRS